MLAAYTGVTWPAMAGIAVLAEPLIRLLYGERWMAAAPLLTWVALSQIGYVALPLYADLPVLMGRLKPLMRCMIIETVLSVRSVLPTMPSMAGLSAAHLSAILFPRTLRRLYVARDNDPAGDRAMSMLVERASGVGIEAIVLTPRLGDFNEDLRRLGRQALGAWLRDQLAAQDIARFMLLAA